MIKNEKNSHIFKSVDCYHFRLYEEGRTYGNRSKLEVEGQVVVHDLVFQLAPAFMRREHDVSSLALLVYFVLSLLLNRIP
jgi:hypothetical protein